MNGRLSQVFSPLVLGRAAALALALSLLVIPSGSQAARRAGKAQPRVVERADGEKFIKGFVESTGIGYFFVNGSRYDVTRAKFVAPDGKPSNATAIHRGSKVSLTLRRGQVVEIQIIVPPALE